MFNLIPNVTSEMLPPFPVRETIVDPFGLLYVSAKGISHRYMMGSEPVTIPNRRRYMAKSGNPSTNVLSS